MSQSLRDALSPLLQALEGGRVVRLTARPGAVVLDRPEGTVALPVPWDQQQQARAVELLENGAELPGGAFGCVIGDMIVIVQSPSPARRTEDLADDGWVSPLAGRLLSASLELGKNVLLMGAWPACRELAAALVAEGVRPAVVGTRAQPVPAGWARLADAEAVTLVGADRVGAWSVAPRDLPSLLSRCVGVVGWLEARRLERGLMRLEVAMTGGAESVPAPLQVLASLDLVVMVGDGPRVTEIAEICLTEEGYRPRLLFASGIVPVPSALVPVAPPSYLAELSQRGHYVLSDELQHASATSMPRPPPPEPDRPQEPRAAAELPRERSRTREPQFAARLESADAVNPSVEPVSDVPPGWELDQLTEGDLEGEQGNHTSEDAALAATFGLAPPPRPPGVREGKGFEDALKRARERTEGDDVE